MTLPELALRVAASLIFGALIGAERQYRQRNAGLRTNTLVSVGSALFVSLSFLLDGDVSPTRVAAQVVSGIGFLGAGVILREGMNIRGLNTAATLWCSAAAGVLCGAGFLAAALVGTLAILSANVFLRPVAARLNRHHQDDTEEGQVYRMGMECHRDDEIHVRALLLEGSRATDMTVRSVATQKTKRQRVRLQCELVAAGLQDERIEHLMARLCLQPPVLAIRWQAQGQANAHF